MSTKTRWWWRWHGSVEHERGQALRDKKDTWCGYAEIELRQLIDSTLKEYKS